MKKKQYTDFKYGCLLRLIFPAIHSTLTFINNLGEGYSEIMASAISGLTFLNCSNCCFQTFNKPWPDLSTLTPVKPSSSNENT